MIRDINPSVEVDDSNIGGTIRRHQAFGTVSASRISGHRDAMFGSSVGHHGVIRLSIRRAFERESLGERHIFPKEELIEVEMTEAQWVALISRMNVGFGVPCTLRRFNGVMIPGIVQQVRGGARLDEAAELLIEESARESAKCAEQARAALAGLPKKKQDEISSLINLIERNGKRNREFHADQLRRLNESLVSDSKIEIDAMTTAVARSFGVETIKQLGAILSADPGKAMLLIAKENGND